MVTKYGMSETLGPISYSSGNDEVFLGKDYSHIKSYSENIATQIDAEVARIITKSYERTESVLRAHEDKLHLVAGKLIEKEKLDGDEFESLLKE